MEKPFPPISLKINRFFLFISNVKCEPQKTMERAILKGSQFIVIYFKMNSTIESISTQ